MLQRRSKTKVECSLTAGPGVLSIALGVTTEMNGLLLTGPQIWIEDRAVNFSEEAILTSPRIGIDYAQEHAQLPWRFRIKNHPFTSPAK